jgi:solute carrier family 25 carnitine/acylcarnitine transporter 20/29
MTMTMNDDDTKVSATSPATVNDYSFWGNLATINIGSLTPTLNFLPDFTEHPKPKKRIKRNAADSTSNTTSDSNNDNDDNHDEHDITFLHDFIAGGFAGSASVIVGHPFDTIKVRMQTSKSATTGLMATLKEFGGSASLFRGMTAPLGAAAVINAIVFSSYGVGSRFFDEYIIDPDDWPETDHTHDPWQKSYCCGSFAGLVQSTVICPMEHIKCRLQVQGATATAGTADTHYKGPVQATKRIIQQHGVQRLYQGWWSTVWREVPAFGLYFATYDYMKDTINTILNDRDDRNKPTPPQHTHTWIASAFAGGCAGCLTWAIVYPIDVIKTTVQTAALDAPLSTLSIFNVGKRLAAQHGWRYLWRGLGITLIRAFPVNGTIFPVYEFALLQVSSRGL